LERSPVGAGGDGQQPKSKSRTTSIPSTYFYTTNQKIISLHSQKMINEFWDDYRVGTAGSWREFVNCVPKNSEFQK
jgi:hypothetical protein